MATQHNNPKHKAGRQDKGDNELNYRNRKEVGEEPLSSMRSKDIVAIFVADIHLSHQPPAFRAVEPDWYEAMARQLRELQKLVDLYQCPLVCAGDVFDRPHSVPELVNFAIRTLPRMYAIPGQHDLLWHNYQDIRKTSYWTLVEAGIVKDMKPRTDVWNPTNVGQLCLHPFPWGRELTTNTRIEKWALGFDVAVVHSYIWIKHKGFEGAPTDKRLHAYKDQLQGYDAVVFGDNHSGFIVGKVCNCGTFFRRRADEVNYKPRVGLLHSDGKITPHYLDCSQDKFLELEEVRTEHGPTISPESLLNALDQLEISERDFYAIAKQFGEKLGTAKDIMKILFRAIREGRK